MKNGRIGSAFVFFDYRCIWRVGSGVLGKGGLVYICLKWLKIHGELFSEFTQVVWDLAEKALFDPVNIWIVINPRVI